MFLILFLCALPVILYIDDNFLKFICISLWYVLVAFTTCVALYIDRDGKGSGEDE